MKIRKFYLNSDKEVIVKIVKEILTLFKVQIAQSEDELCDHEWIKIENQVVEEELITVKTKFIIKSEDLAEISCERFSTAKSDENQKAAMHRLIKLNLYHIFLEELSMPPAPWGILHGVRPTKIVHRYIDAQMNFEDIAQRLQTDYEVSSLKAEVITRLAFKQRPFLQTSDNKTVSIYVGIPFCLSRCLYCSFPSNVLPKDSELQRFLAVLKKDLLAAKASVKRHQLKVQTIYIGGGTPTSLPDTYFNMLLDWVHEAFYTDTTIEFTVEAGRPDSITPGKIESMIAHGVDRVSVNPQTMQAKTLQKIGRQHTPEAIVDMFKQFRSAKMKHINMDLIIGLPGETPADVEDTMKKVIALGPDDITLHALALKKGSKLKMHLEDIDLPTDESVQKMFDIALYYVSKMDLEPYYLYRQGYMSGQLENVGCSRSGAESMYNIQIMEEHQSIIGIGGAATTKVVHPVTQRLQTSFNAKDLTTYLNCVDKYIEKRSALLDEAFDQ